MKNVLNRTALHGLVAVLSVCLGISLWFIAGSFTDPLDVKTAGVLKAVGFFAILAGLPIGGSAPVFHIALRRTSIGILYFVPTFLLCFLLLGVVGGQMYDNARKIPPTWFDTSVLVASVVVALVVAIYLAIRRTQPKPADLTSMRNNSKPAPSPANATEDPSG